MTTSQRIGIDTGGTFTDVVAVSDRRGLVVHKLPSTPDDPARAVLAGVAAVLRPDAVADLVHGTTVGLNAVLTGRLPRTAFVTNAGFEDLIEIGRQARAEIYDLTARRPLLPVPRHLRVGIAERRTAGGERGQCASSAELHSVRERLARGGVEAIAVGLLFGFAHPEDELAVAEALRPLGVPITCSGDLLPASGEYERFSAAILNAAMTPVMGRYIDRLQSGIAPGRVRLLRSSGGIMPAAEAARFPARAAFSGPAGGVGACRALQRSWRCGPVAAFDMGGTSTDVCFLDAQGKTVRDHDQTLAGLPLPVPAVPVHTVGCGGGSLARVDAGGALRVGPESAGADPGPACYGKGDEPTVTDAHVALGHIAAETLLGGGFPIDPQRSMRALEPLARRMGLSIRRAAEGILQVADTAMLRALLVITAARAIDPSAVTLVAFGGAGGLHAARLAAALAMPRAIVPAHPGAFSAIGLALAHETAEVLVPVHREVGSSWLRMQRIADRAARDVLRSVGPGGHLTELSAHLRARGQGSAVAVPWTRDLADAFRRHHHHLYGFEPSSDAIDLVGVSARAATATRPLPPVRQAAKGRARAATRTAPAGGAPLRVFARSELSRAQVLLGPAVVEEATGVTLVPPGWRLRSGPHGLELTRAR